ncbi:MAG: methyltransferase [Betaproteobacteria bacterium]|nr:MAG: methyltransferase [Betaproteobacteria bacterium]
MTPARALAAACAVLALANASAPAGAQSGAPDLDTPYVTTPDNVVRAMLDLAGVRAGERLLDLGSGDGRIVVAAARRGAVAHGVEIDPRLVAASRENARAAGLEARATFAAQDLFETDYAGTDVVTMYLLPDVNARLAPRLYATLRPGARIVSHDYGLGDWPADATIEVDAPGKTVGVAKRSTLHRWTVPAKVGGGWSGGAGAEAVALELAQAWQSVSGTLRWRGRTLRIAERRIEGTRVDLVADGGAGSVTLRLAAIGDGRLAGELLAAGEAPRRVELVRAAP